MTTIIDLPIEILAHIIVFAIHKCAKDKKVKYLLSLELICKCFNNAINSYEVMSYMVPENHRRCDYKNSLRKYYRRRVINSLGRATLIYRRSDTLNDIKFRFAAQQKHPYSSIICNNLPENSKQIVTVVKQKKIMHDFTKKIYFTIIFINIINIEKIKNLRKYHTCYKCDTTTPWIFVCKKLYNEICREFSEISF